MSIFLSIKERKEKAEHKRKYESLLEPREDEDWVSGADELALFRIDKLEKEMIKIKTKLTKNKKEKSK